MSDNYKSVEPSEYWDVLPTSSDWSLNCVSKDGYRSAYIKGDGCTHVWEYASPKQNRSSCDPSRTGEDEETFLDEEAIYRHVCDLDAEIVHLLALRETAIRHFEAHGALTAREEWYYGKPLPATIATIPPRSEKEQAAYFAQLEETRWVERVQSYVAFGVAEEDIPNISSIFYEDGIHTITLWDGRSWQKRIERQEEQP